MNKALPKILFLTFLMVNLFATISYAESKHERYYYEHDPSGNCELGELKKLLRSDFREVSRVDKYFEFLDTKKDIKTDEQSEKWIEKLKKYRKYYTIERYFEMKSKYKECNAAMPWPKFETPYGFPDGMDLNAV